MLIEFISAGIILSSTFTDTSLLTATEHIYETRWEDSTIETVPVYGRNFTHLTEEEFDALCLLVAAEAENISGDAQTRFLAKEAVAEVVLNRIESDKHPDNIYDVMNYPNAFAVMTNGRYGKIVPSEETVDACYAALSSVNYDKNMCYFNSIDYFNWADDYMQYSNLYFSTEP